MARKAKAPATKKYHLGARPHYRKGVYYPAHSFITIPADEMPGKTWTLDAPPEPEDKGETPEASPPEA